VHAVYDHFYRQVYLQMYSVLKPLYKSIGKVIKLG